MNNSTTGQPESHLLQQIPTTQTDQIHHHNPNKPHNPRIHNKDTVNTNNNVNINNTVETTKYKVPNTEYNSNDSNNITSVDGLSKNLINTKPIVPEQNVQANLSQDEMRTLENLLKKVNNNPDLLNMINSQPDKKKE